MLRKNAAIKQIGLQPTEHGNWEGLRHFSVFASLGSEKVRALVQRTMGPVPDRDAGKCLVAVEASSSRPIPQGCLDSLEFLLTHEIELCLAVLASLPKYCEFYRREQVFYDNRITEADMLDETWPPKDANVESLRPLIAFHGVVIHAAQTGLSDLGFMFECSWDPENGLGVRVRGHDVVSVGFGYCATDPWECVQSHIQSMGDGLEWRK